MPLSRINQKKIRELCTALKGKLKDRSSKFGRDYLRLLVDEISIKGKEVYMKGYNSALAGALLASKVGTPLDMAGVPTLIPAWLPGTDSNCRQGG